MNSSFGFPYIAYYGRLTGLNRYSGFSLLDIVDLSLAELDCYLGAVP